MDNPPVSQTPGTNVNNITYNISLSPLYFVYGGYTVDNFLNGAGNNGYYWSFTLINDTNAYFLFFNTDIIPSGGSTRYVGLSVRCVAR